MIEQLFPYYNRELVFFRQLATEFAKRYPGPASRLLLDLKGGSSDPHVERLIEAVAFLTARVHHKLDDEFPELTDALLGVLYPHYLAPIPSMAIVQFDVDPARAQLPHGFLIEKHSRLQTQPVGDLPCRFRTGYPVTLWPLTLTAARLLTPPFPSGLRPPDRTVAALRLQLECMSEMTFAGLSLDKLRFYLYGEDQLIAQLYELLFNHTIQAHLRPLDGEPRPAPVVLEREQCLSQVGFEPEDGLLPYPSRSFPGYRLLTEFFAFPNKFFFVDIGGWSKAARNGFRTKAEVVLYLDRSFANLEQAIDTSTFRLGCTPIVNLFEQTAEPVALTQAEYEYRVVPDRAQPKGMEIYSIDSVTSADPATSTVTEYQPFYSFRHHRGREQQRAFWHPSRRPAKDDRGTEVYVNLVDLDFNPRLPADEVLVVRTTCTNRDLPTELQRAGEELFFSLEQAAPLSSIHCLRVPSASLRPPLRRGAHWRLISHLCLNHLSIADEEEGREALQEILRLYDFSDPEAGRQMAEVNRQLIEGIVSVRSRRVVGRTGGPTSSGFARGVEVTIELDEANYAGTGVLLFASVLERFLGLYASINSFSQLIGKTKQGEGAFKTWRPRAAELPLL